MASRVLDTDQRGKPQRDPPYRRMRQLGSRTRAPASPRTDASHWLALIGSRGEMDHRLQHLFNCPRSTSTRVSPSTEMVFQDLSKIHACGWEGAVFHTPELCQVRILQRDCKKQSRVSQSFPEVAGFPRLPICLKLPSHGTHRRSL